MTFVNTVFVNPITPKMKKIITIVSACWLAICSSLTAQSDFTSDELIQSISSSDSYAIPGFNSKYFNSENLEKSTSIIVQFLREHSSEKILERMLKEDVDSQIVHQASNALVAIACLRPTMVAELAQLYTTHDNFYIQTASLKALSVSGTDESAEIIFAFIQEKLSELPNEGLDETLPKQIQDSYIKIAQAYEAAYVNFLSSESQFTSENSKKLKDLIYFKFAKAPNAQKEIDEFIAHQAGIIATRKEMHKQLKSGLEVAVRNDQ